MNAFVDLEQLDRKSTLAQVGSHIVAQQKPAHWTDVIGGCDDCSTVPYDVVAAGRTKTMVLENNQLVMREASFGSILG